MDNPVLLIATGVEANSSWDSGDTDVLDLIPPGLPTTAALDLLNAFDPKKYATDNWARGVSAGQAILCRPDLATTPPDPADPTEFTVFVRAAKEHVHLKVDIAVAPGLQAAQPNPAHRAAKLRQHGKRPTLWVAGSVIGYLVVTTAVVTAWPWGLLAVAAYCAHPALALAGTPLRPKDLLAATLLRPLRAPQLWYQTLKSKWRSTQEHNQTARLEAATPWYEAQIEQGISRFFEKSRDSCPACGSADLRLQVRSVDLIQRKPGEFTMDRCVRCAHVWQNPRLSEEGLGFYYRDFYDGLGEGAADAVFSIKNDPYYGRARMVQPFTTPQNWLDVGSGHAHFCLGAKEVLPTTTFDGLDQGAAIEEAATKGRIEKAYRGTFKDFAPELRGRYDVISMHHYLEHVRDPWEELDIAADVLPEGGYLLIELPDPEWRLGWKFGRYWMPWFQPQHQHMMPIENLKHELADRHLTTVAEERSKAHMQNDFMLAALLFLGAKAPRTPAPWRPEKPKYKTLRSAAVWTLGIPLFLVAAALDQTLNRALAHRNDRGNAYRVLARKEAE
ncbi:class I SAM-dependent methyltransferase [Lentzea tibetensis]|uniref:Class I SAM-dependent methyltransferase n=1 Tax=Lentzea tibetensis TaxID=2591470 RepID=A0A563F1S2_9PSEU|nr:class I SAM-dependent methyltransferase [Lentzea tibetensis]TWP53688.1 class I SAM-dependent methyltransferase [Lentzea tibetensis]